MIQSQSHRYELKLTFQTGGERSIIQTLQNPLFNSDTIVTQISNLNSYLEQNNDFWYEDPKTPQESESYTDENKITKVVKAEIFEQSKTVEDNKTTLVEITETIYKES